MTVEPMILLAAAAAVLTLCVLVMVLLFQARRERDQLKRDVEEKTAGELKDFREQLLGSITGFTGSYSDYIQSLLRQNDEFASRSQQQRAAADSAMTEQLQRVEAQMENLRRLVDEKLLRMSSDNARQLEEMRRTVDEKLNDQLEKRLNASFSQVSERLEQVYRSLGEVQSLAGGVSDLKHMLSGVKTRGVWGEVQLGALLSETMTESQYQSNVMVVPGSGERVEYAVCLPGREKGEEPVLLPIDSKFPLDAYLHLADAARDGSETAVDTARKALLTAIKTEAKRIGKYIAPPHSTDFAIMFLPMESLYAEVMCHTEAVESIRREQRVLIAGPSTLQALLSSLQMGFRTLAIEKRSAEVWKLLGAVKVDFRNYALLLEKTQEKLRQASSSVDAAFTKTRTIERRLRNVESLEENEAAALLGGDASDWSKEEA